MKKVLLLLIACMFTALNVQAQTGITGVILNRDTMILPVNMSNDTALIAHVQTNNPTEKEVSWILQQGNNSIIDFSGETLNNLSVDTIFSFKSKNLVGKIEIVAETSPISANLKDTCVVRIVIPADGITFNHTDTLFMYIDDDTKEVALLLEPLIATISPSNATDAFVIWENLNGNIVEIDTTDNTCHIKALKRDTAKIVAKICYDYDKSGELFGLHTDTCVIVVRARVVESLTLSGLEAHEINDDGEYVLSTGDEFDLTAHLLPSRGIDKSVIWDRSDYNVIGTGSGLDTIRTFNASTMAVGPAKIFATSLQTMEDFPLDRTQWVTDTVKVRVYGVRAEGLSLSHDTIRMNRPTTAVPLPVEELIATVSPHNTYDKSIAWSIDGPSNVTFSVTDDTICEINSLWADTTKIVAMSNDNNDFKDTCVVVVYVPVDSVVFTIDDNSIGDTIDVEINDIHRLKAVVYPDTATVKSVTWEIRDPSLINQTFVLRDTVCDITALKKGGAKIYAMVTDWDGAQRKDSIVFNIDYKPITGVSLNMDDTVRITKFEEHLLTVTVSPLGANDSVIWTSSDSLVVDILSTGYDTVCTIKALAVDTAKIYVVSKIDAAFKDSCVFIVNSIPVEEVVLSPDTLEMYLDHKLNLVASIEPWEATDRAVTWTSTNPAVVEILSIVNDTVCEISGKSLGESKIYAIALDGIAKDSCVVKVKQQFIFLETDTANVNGGIEFFITIPATSSITGSFELQLPKGFGLTKGEVSLFRSALVEDFKDALDLSIYRVNDSTYIFAVLPKETPSSIQFQAGTKVKLMDIVYTVYDTDLEDSKENYLASLVDVVFEFSNNTKIEEEQVPIVIKSFKDPTGNEPVDNPRIFAYIINNRLYVNSEKAETVSVYSLNGSLLFARDKKEGQAVFNLNTTEKVLIVTGSSGWANKVSNL